MGRGGRGAVMMGMVEGWESRGTRRSNRWRVYNFDKVVVQELDMWAGIKSAYDKSAKRP